LTNNVDQRPETQNICTTYNHHHHSCSHRCSQKSPSSGANANSRTLVPLYTQALTS
jgi:hypothetical protein